MTTSHRTAVARFLDRVLFGTLLFVAMLLIGVQIARAEQYQTYDDGTTVGGFRAEIVPSVGLTSSVHSEDNDVKISGGLALRGRLAPMFKGEIGASYRSETLDNGALHVRMWPITTSLWVTPFSTIYAGGGVGWYQTTYDYDETLAIQDETQQQFGVHLGGGFGIPLAGPLTLDLNGRYVFLDKVRDKISTRELDPDFWTTSLGLAIRF
jgi:opacity protein-like surface antigen